LGKGRTKNEQTELRDLAGRTLEAYRELNSAAADAAYGDASKVGGENLARAGEILESVLSSLKRGGSHNTAQAG
jgi:hypothetical protein